MSGFCTMPKLTSEKFGVPVTRLFEACSKYPNHPTFTGLTPGQGKISLKTLLLFYSKRRRSLHWPWIYSLPTPWESSLLFYQFRGDVCSIEPSRGCLWTYHRGIIHCFWNWKQIPTPTCWKILHQTWILESIIGPNHKAWVGSRIHEGCYFWFFKQLISVQHVFNFLDEKLNDFNTDAKDSRVESLELLTKIKHVLKDAYPDATWH